MVSDAELFATAEAVRTKAHVPYSRFAVGAAILADDGKIYSGCNVENAAYPVGNCAEASAIAAMVAGGGKRIREFADLDVTVISHGVEGQPLHATFGELLPHSFGPEFLPQ